MAFIPYKDRDIAKDELACVYGALILADDDIPVTVDKLTTVLQAANIEVESIWPSLFARALQGINVKHLIIQNLGAGAGPGGSAGASVGAEATVGGSADEPAKEEGKKPEVEEEEDSDDDFGLNLFD